MTFSVVPSFHGYPRLLLSDSRSAAPPPRLPLLFTPPSLSVPQIRKTRSPDGFCAGAVKSRRKGRNDGVVEMKGFDDDDEEDEDEDGMFVPFGKMKRWLEDKPQGFGVGKVYDTSLEDKLLDEISQSLQAQAANINKLKNAPVEPIPKKHAPQLKVTEETPSGIRVRIVNLPKKKNIHRDLKLAFDGTPGILNIVPMVSGNSKTRDPVCKGFAFVDFKSEEDAVRFVQIFSRQSITFGKVQKQIKCEIMNLRLPIAADGESENETSSGAAASQQPDLDLGAEPAASSEVDDSFSDSWEDLISEEENDSDGDIETELVETCEDMEDLGLLELDPSNSMDLESVSPTASFSQGPETRAAFSTKDQGRSRAKGHKPKGKGSGLKVKVPKLEVPGSAKRLKIKEKAVLTGVLSKYGAKADVTLNGES